MKMLKSRRDMNIWIRTILFFLVLTVIGIFIFSSHAMADIFIKTPSLEMPLEKIETGPVPLDHKQ